MPAATPTRSAHCARHQSHSGVPAKALTLVSLAAKRGRRSGCRQEESSIVRRRCSVFVLCGTPSFYVSMSFVLLNDYAPFPEAKIALPAHHHEESHFEFGAARNLVSCSLL